MFLLLFWFLVNQKFPSNSKKILIFQNLLWKKQSVKLVKQFDKLDYKYRKLLLELKFPENCIDGYVTPAFLQFRWCNRGLRDLSAHWKVQETLFKQDVISKNRRLRLAKRDESSVQNEFLSTLCWLFSR